MSLEIQAAGVNAFLDMVYGPNSRPSELLAALGCTPEQVALLETRYREAFMQGFVRRIAERLVHYRTANAGIRCCRGGLAWAASHRRRLPC